MILFRLPIKPRTKFTLPGFLLSCSLGLKACDCSCEGYNKVRNKKGRQSIRSWKSFFIISNYVSMNSLILTEVTEQLGPGKNKKIIQLFSCFYQFLVWNICQIWISKHGTPVRILDIFLTSLLKILFKEGDVCLSNNFFVTKVNINERTSLRQTL